MSTDREDVKSSMRSPSPINYNSCQMNNNNNFNKMDLNNCLEPIASTKSLFLFASRFWKTAVALLVPCGLFPILFFYDAPEVRCACVVLMMASYWMLEPIHISATALLPVALFPLLGVVSTSEISISYMKSANMMFFGGLLMAIAIERSELHKRVALKVLLVVGTSVKRITLGIMLTTMFLSMWISNTATTAMMVPIVDFMLDELDAGRRSSDRQQAANAKAASFCDDDKEELKLVVRVISRRSSHSDRSRPFSSAKKQQTGNGDAQNSNCPRSRSNSVRSLTTITGRFSTSVPMDLLREQELLDRERERERKKQLVRRALFLGVAYAANIGGTGTLTGTGTNLVLQGLLEEMYPNSKEITFASWFLYAAPSMLFSVLLSWLFLHLVYIRSNDDSTAIQRDSVRKLMEQKYRQLGKVSFHQKAVMVCFFVLVALWFLRDPQFIPGWATLMGVEASVSDATPAILIALLMFVIPTNWNQFSRTHCKSDGGKVETLLDWPTVQQRMPWGVIILLGGGFAMAEGTNRSGLSKWLGQEISNLDIASPRVALVVLVIAATLITEIASNVATASVVLPVVNQLALGMGANPLLLMLPVTISVSFAFMFPVATPPNAIVYEKLNIATWDMVKPGIVMEVICVVVQLAMINTLGIYMFSLDTFPDWAMAQPVANWTTTAH